MPILVLNLLTNQAYLLGVMYTTNIAKELMTPQSQVEPRPPGYETRRGREGICQRWLLGAWYADFL